MGGLQLPKSPPSKGAAAFHEMPIACSPAQSSGLWLRSIIAGAQLKHRMMISEERTDRRRKHQVIVGSFSKISLSSARR